MRMLVSLVLEVVNSIAKQVRRKKAAIQDTPTSSPVQAQIKSATKSPASPTPRSKNSNFQGVFVSTPRKKQKTIEEDQSDSDMSILNDSRPPMTKPRKQTTKDPNRSTTKSSSNTTKPVTSSSEDEIKHLKSLVFKCGVRKNWYYAIFLVLINT